MSNKIKSASRMAARDISAHIREKGIQIFTSSRNGIDVWVVTPETLMNKESRRLNRIIGVNSVNYSSNNFKSPHHS